VKALITGITGFVGGHLAEHLLGAGDEVVGLSTSGQWPARTPEALVQRVRVLACDLASDDSAQQLAQLSRDFAPDHIYHLAAISVPSDCGGDEPTPRAIAANVDATRRLLEWASTLSSPRVLFVSTSHVYAPPSSRDGRFREDQSPQPKNGYGKTKLMAEKVVRDAVDAHGVDALIARAFQHTGPRQGSRMMLPEWAAQFAAGADPVAVRNRDTWIDLSDVRDVVRAYRLLMLQGARGETYNVGAGVARRTGDILDQLVAIAGEPPTIVESRPGERFDPIADIAKLQSTTGWRSEVPLEQTIRDIWHWFKQ
jgi:GDP-4-dehydro-6-deoxy-D-mannose reductase